MRLPSLRHILATTAVSALLLTGNPAHAQFGDLLNSVLPGSSEKKPEQKGKKLDAKSIMDSLLKDANRAQRILLQGELLRLDAYELLVDADAVYRQALIAHKFALQAQKDLASGSGKVAEVRKAFQEKLLAVKNAHRESQAKISDARKAAADLSKREAAKIEDADPDGFGDIAASIPSHIGAGFAEVNVAEAQKVSGVALAAMNKAADEVKKAPGARDEFFVNIYLPTISNMAQAQVALDASIASLDAAKRRLDAMAVKADKVQKELTVETVKVVALLAGHAIVVKQLVDSAGEQQGLGKIMGYVGAAATVAQALDVISSYTNLLNAHGKKADATNQQLNKYKQIIAQSGAAFQNSSTVAKNLVSSLDKQAQSMFGQPVS